MGRFRVGVAVGMALAVCFVTAANGQNVAVCLGGELQPLEAGRSTKLALKSTLEVLKDLEKLEITRRAKPSDGDTEAEDAEAEDAEAEDPEDGDATDEDPKGEKSKDDKPEAEAGQPVFSRTGGAAKGYRLSLETFAATTDAGATYKIVSAIKGGETEEVTFTLEDVAVPPCSPAAAKATDQETREKLDEIMSRFAPDTRSIQEFGENAVVTIDAATGEITPGSRIKIRRGHYAVINVRNGLVLDIGHAQSYSEGGNLFEGSPRPRKVTGLGSPGQERGRIVGGSGQGLAEAILDELELSDPKRVELSTLSLQAVLRTPEALEQAAEVEQAIEGFAGQKSAWIRAGFRESVFTISVLPYERDGKKLDLKASDSGTLQRAITEYTVTLNAQKWGVGTMAGFAFANTDEKEYIYVNNPDEETKTIATAADSSATPFPSFFVNFWQWSRPQWAASLGVALDSSQNRPLYSLGASYLFSRHGQITVGAALVPERNLPRGFRTGDVVPLADTTLQGLKDEYHVRPILAIGWSFGSQGGGDSAAETEPVKK